MLGRRFNLPNLPYLWGQWPHLTQCVIGPRVFLPNAM